MISLLAAPFALAGAQNVDVVIYGGTPAGLAAATAAVPSVKLVLVQVSV